MKLYEALTGRLLAICPGHKSLVTALAFSPQGGYLASASNDCTVKVWDRTPAGSRPTASDIGSG